MTTWRGLRARDRLTGLPERTGAHSALARALRRRGECDEVAVAAVGLDRFSGVNTALGREAGNVVLRAVADRLRQEGMAAARLGGDEFAVVALGPDARRIGELVGAALRRPVEVAGRSVFLGASIGVATAPTDGEEPEVLLQHADTAMQLAKERGGGLVLRYAGDLQAEVEDRLAIASGLQQAIERGELVLHYQPIVDAGSRAIVGMEALVRWEHPTLGTIAPDCFIPIAEDTGLIVPLGEWVLDEACRQAVRWQRHRRLRLAVNLSARQLEHQRIDDVVARALQSSGLDPRLLDIELTERAVLHDDAEVAAVLERLRALGVGCSVDDFGTGYGGLSYLIQFPVVELKIDRSFVREIDAAGDHAAIVVGLIALARDLGLRVVAEGVEHASQARFLVEHGCDELQGFLISRPVPAAQFEALLDGSTVATAPVIAPRPSVAPRRVDTRACTTRPSPVRPGPRRTRRRLAPAIALCAAGALLSTTGQAAALPELGVRTVAAIVSTVQDAVPALQLGPPPSSPSQSTPTQPDGGPAGPSPTPSETAPEAAPRATPAIPATPTEGRVPPVTPAEASARGARDGAPQDDGAAHRPDEVPADTSKPTTPTPAEPDPTPAPRRDDTERPAATVPAPRAEPEPPVEHPAPPSSAPQSQEQATIEPRATDTPKEKAAEPAQPETGR